MLGLGLPELLIILVIALVVFGAGKLPEIGSGLGRALRGFKKEMTKPDEIDVTPAESPPEIPEGKKEETNSAPVAP